MAEVKEEVWTRWNDAALKKRVEEYLGGRIPKFLKNEPRAVIIRNIISPNLEYLRFRELAHGLGLEPLGLEYLEDRFCTHNVDKLGLGEMRIFQGRDRKGAAITQSEKIIDVKVSDNKPFGQIQTLWGEDLVDFHRALLVEHLGKHEVFDLSGWIDCQSTNALENYRNLFTIFTCFGVLFENFVTNDKVSTDFATRVAYPAFADVRNALGVSPLVTRIYSEAELEDISCWCWPVSAQASILDRRTIGSAKRRLIDLFRKYCSNCDGTCCNEYHDITLFNSELQRLPIDRDELVFCRQSDDATGANGAGVVDIDISKFCPFLEREKGCGLNLWLRPLDCFSYPIYPVIKYNGNDSKELSGMMVHRNCRFAEEMVRDDELMSKMREFWERKLHKVGTDELWQWFGYEKAFWRESNWYIQCR